MPGEHALSQYPSYGATDNDYCGPGSKPAAAVFWTSATGVMFVLGRAWGPENFFLICAMLLLIMFGALILSEFRNKMSWFKMTCLSTV